MKYTAKILALLLAILMLFASCDVLGVSNETEGTNEVTTGTFTESPTESETFTDDTEESESEEVTEEETLDPYRASISRSREEIESMITLADGEFDAAREKLKEFESMGLVSEDYEAVDAVYLEFEDMFYYLDTQISLANIVYDLDRSNKDASSRYLDNYELFGDLYTEYMITCRKLYLESPISEQLFADWTEDDIKYLLSYTPEIQELRQENEQLLVEYNELSRAAVITKGGQIYAQIVANNNRIAELSGYDNYYAYATKEIYGRDYTVEEIDAFKGYIKSHLLPLLDGLYLDWNGQYSSLGASDRYFMSDFLSDPFDSFTKNYLEGYVNSYDNSTGEGFKHLFENRNMIFSNSENSHNSAYQTYLEDFEMPFCLFGSNGQSTSTIVHEMGHYYASLYSPDVSSYDIAETQSQANEFLFLIYAKDEMKEDPYNALESYNLYNTVAMIIICAIIDDFEQRVYSLDSVDGYAYNDFKAIMDEVCEEYGGTTYINTKITNIQSYWTMVCPNSPVYYISYATSSIASVSIYAIAKEDEAAAREVYRKLIEEIDEDDGFKEALNKIGLIDPFNEEAFNKLDQTVFND